MTKRQQAGIVRQNAYITKLESQNADLVEALQRLLDYAIAQPNSEDNERVQHAVIKTCPLCDARRTLSKAGQPAQ